MRKNNNKKELKNVNEGPISVPDTKVSPISDTMRAGDIIKLFGQVPEDTLIKNVGPGEFETVSSYPCKEVQCNSKPLPTTCRDYDLNRIPEYMDTMEYDDDIYDKASEYTSDCIQSDMREIDKTFANYTDHFIKCINAIANEYKDNLINYQDTKNMVIDNHIMAKKIK